MALITAAHMAFTFGILGNVVSFMMYMAPLPTFYKIYKRKSSEGFQAIPYSVALFSAMVYLYYAYLKKNVILLITINSFGCVMELGFLTIFMVYATYESKIYTTKILFLFNVVAMGLIVGCTYSLSKGHKRVTIVGWICSVFSLCVFAAPLSIMRRVIKTKSVEYMPLTLSLFLTLCAVVWFFYGLFIKDFYIAAPNVVGFLFGIAQIILYLIYKDKKKESILPENKVHDISTNKDRNSRDHMQNSSTVEIATVIDHDHGEAHRGTN